MPLSWYHVEPALSLAKSAERAREMYIKEAKERAALLMRLGCSRAEAVRRLSSNLAWDFELHAFPKPKVDIPGLVDHVYAKRGPGGGGPPTPES